jgi:ribose-phosphate pyrophosphokinase
MAFAKIHSDLKSHILGRRWHGHRIEVSCRTRQASNSESEQWVSTVAKDAGATYTVLEKVRRGDRDVEISVKNLVDLGDRTPVLVDDIISTGRTMLEAIRLLTARGIAPPVCVAVHGLFAADAYEALLREGARVVTCNTVPHPSNAIDVHNALGQALRMLLLD